MDEKTMKNLAKYMALSCFRNTELENLHAGIYPSSVKGDYSDVKVVSPYGEIAWSHLGRLSDEEMKVLMIDVVNHCYVFLKMMNNKKGIWKDLLAHFKENDILPEWNEPEEPEDHRRASGNYPHFDLL